MAIPLLKRVSFACSAIAIAGFVFLLCADSASAQIGRRLRLRRSAKEWKSRHAWVRFEKGAWRKSRTTIQILKDGQVVRKGIEETTVTLTDVGLLRYTLTVEKYSVVEGRRIAFKPRTYTVGVFGNQIDNGSHNRMNQPQVSSLDSATITVNDKKFNSFGRRVSVQDGDTTTNSKFYWNVSVSPFPLRVETEKTNRKDRKVELTQLREVLALDMPAMVNSKIVSTMVVRTKEQNLANGTKTTAISVEQLSDLVPGGTVIKSVKTMNKKGEIVHLRSVQLISYGGTVSGRRRGRRN